GVAADGQLGVDAGLDGGELRLGHAAALGPGPALRGQPGQRLPPHEVERAAQVDDGGTRVVVQAAACPGDHGVEALEVGGDLVARDQRVAGVGRLDGQAVAGRGQAAAQAGDEHLDRVVGLPGRRVPVDDV